jgi:hypothetical protein
MGYAYRIFNENFYATEVLRDHVSKFKSSTELRDWIALSPYARGQTVWGGLGAQNRLHEFISSQVQKWLLAPNPVLIGAPPTVNHEIVPSTHR